MKNVIDPQILVIQKVSTVITRERDVEALLESVLSILESDLGMIRGTFALLYGDTLRIEVSRGLAETEKKLGHYRIGEGITGHVAETGVSHVIPDLRNDSRFLNSSTGIGDKSFHGLTDLLSGVSGIVSQLPDLVGNNRKASSCLSCSCCLYGSIE